MYRSIAARRTGLWLALWGSSVGAGLFLAAWQAQAQPATRPASDATARQPHSPATQSAPAASSPASQPATFPSAALAEAAQEEARKLRERLADRFQVIVEPPFVVGGNMSAQELRTRTRDSVIAPAYALWTSYFRARPDKVITVLLLTDEATYRATARRLFGDQNVSHYGYYRPQDRTMVMNIATGGGTLVHELTHALIVYDWPDVPLWFNEGLASLHEQCYVTPDHLVGRPNWRLPAIQEAIRKGTLRPLAEMIAADDFYGPLQPINYAQARYFCYYLQDKGLLGDFYRAYRQGSADDTPVAAVIERVCGQSIADVDQAMRELALTLQFP